MNNLPSGCTQDMVDAQCSPVAKGVEECAECGENHTAADMHAWKRYSWSHRMVMDVYLCKYCVPKCAWLHNENGHVNLDLKPCGSIQSLAAQGPWCAEHDAESMKLDESEEA